MADWWDHVVCASSPADGNINRASAPATIDGVSPPNNSRVLLKHQTTLADNTTWIYTTGTPNKLTTATTDTPAAQAVVRVDQGTVNARTEWALTDTTNYVWT